MNGPYADAAFRFALSPGGKASSQADDVYPC